VHQSSAVRLTPRLSIGLGVVTEVLDSP